MKEFSKESHNLRLLACATTLALLCALLWGTGLPAAAQTASTGAVQGTVTDPSGAVVAGAEVKLVDTATNQSRTQPTSAAGQYTFPNVRPGTYTVSVTLQGFRTATVSALKVEVNKTNTVNFQLEIGAVSEVVVVEPTVGVELQTTDAQIGNVLEQRIMRNLPTSSRSALDLLPLQPVTTPGSFGTGGTVSGARSDQNTLILDGVDISDNLTGGQGASFTQTPVGVDAVSEFRVTVTNPNATFGRSAGGQMTLVSMRGSNTFHGVGYWYHQNDNLNANTWTNNRTGVRKGEAKDNRAGFSFSGPFWQDHTFFSANYEVQRVPQIANFTRTVPTATLRSGILRFLDSAGNTVSYPLATTTLCGTTSTLACDPRGLGLSPTVQAMYALLPAGNDTTLGDGLNTTGFRGSVPTAVTIDAISFRMDHKVTSKLQFMGRYSYRRNLAPSAAQLDIRDPQNVTTLRAFNQRGANITAGFDYMISSNLVNTFRFGWVQNKNDLIGTNPFAVGAELALPGTDSSIGKVGVDLGLLSEAIDVAAQSARTQIIRDRSIQFSNSAVWIKGSHSMSFGGEIRALPFLFTHNDQVTFLTGPIASLASGSFLSIPSTNRPPTCSASITTNCLRTADISRWNNLYAATLGMLDNLSIVGARDGDLNPLPFGSDLVTETSMYYYQFHAQDTWRVRPSLTLTLGLTYSWATPPHEKLDRIALITDRATGEVFSARSYLEAKRDAALQGQVFNPEIGVRPIADSGRDSLFDTDYSNFGPRVAVAWSPSAAEGWRSRLFGNRRMVVRGGFGIVYDRVNTISVILPAAFGIGFGQVLQATGPRCDASGTPGALCNASAGSGNRGLSAFRLGWDGNVPVPAFTGSTSPIVPAVLSGGTTYATDPERKIGRNYLIDVTIQRELPGNLIFEIGYIGRLGRDLPQGADLDSSPYFFEDAVSGQSFTQAYDRVALALRGGTLPAALPAESWFENQLPGLSASALGGSCRPPAVAVALNSTQCLATLQSSLFQTNSVNNLFLQMNIYRQLGLSLPPYNNLQLLAILMATHGGVSNYHAMFFTLRNRPWHGLQFDFNYSLAKSLDQAGNVQNNLALISTGFDANIDYGPALSDRRHILNGIFNYDLPFGSGKQLSSDHEWVNRIIGGWYLSGIYRAYSSLPYTVTDNTGVWGGSLAGLDNAAIPLTDIGSLNPGIHSGVAGSGGVGTAGNPATGGSGLNLFADPEAAFNSFRRIELDRDGRTGRANHFRGPGFWNLDFRVGKDTRITERVSYEFSFDFFNVFNHVNLAAPSLSLNNRANFGVFTSQTGNARVIQFGSRIKF